MSLPFEKKVTLVTGTGCMDLATARGFAGAGAAKIGKPAIAVFDSESYSSIATLHDLLTCSKIIRKEPSLGYFKL